MQDYNLKSINFIKNRFEFFKELRDNHPCWWSEINQCWMISRYDDIVNYLPQYNIFTTKFGVSFNSKKEFDPNKMHEKSINFVENEPVEHLIDRKILSNIITSASEINIKNEINNFIINNIVLNKEIEIYSQLCLQIPYIALFEIFNINNNQKKHLLEKSSILFENKNSEEQYNAMYETYKVLLSDPPKFNTKNNLNDAQKAYYSCVLLMSGSATVTSALMHILKDISENIDQYKLLFNNKFLIKNFVEESIRINLTTQYIYRTCIKEVEIHGCKIMPGDVVVFINGSALCDENIYGPDASLFNLTRESNKINLSFGHGAHKCIGLNLARMQLVYFIESLVNNNIYFNITKNTIKDELDLSTTFYKTINGIFKI